MNIYFQRIRNVVSVDEWASNNVDVDEEVLNNVEFDVTKLRTDHGLRIPILDYNANIRDEVRKAYMLKGPCQPQDHDFPKRQFGVTIRRFNPSWFKETSFGKQGGGESFVGEGFTYWKDKKRLHTHVGLHVSVHNQARIKCEVLMNQEQHIQSVFYKQSEQARNAYVTRLNASIDCVRVLLRQGHSFRGHDESEDSLNPGNFLVQLQFLAAHNEVINAVTLGNAPHSCKLTSPDVQKDIVNACAIETINVIIKDIGDSLFSILVDESCDVSMNEQMSIVLRYVDNSGHVNERFIGIEYDTSTTALSLKAAIDKVFSRYNLSMSRLRGQGYDGASSMQGKFNGLKTLILKESPCAFYIHCFAHQLQLALVAVVKKNIPITNFFRVVGNVMNTVGASSKRCDLLREKQLDFIVEALEKDPLAMIVEDESCSCDQRSDVTNLLELIQRFDFEFNLQLMRTVLGISNELSKALQRKDQDIVNAMQLKNLIRLAELYPLDFSAIYGIVLSDQLETYIFDMRSNKEFEGLNGLGDLAEKLVLTKKDKVYPLVYRLLTLALILPVATATMERVFSAMSIVKNRLRNRVFVMVDLAVGVGFDGVYAVKVFVVVDLVVGIGFDGVCRDVGGDGGSGGSGGSNDDCRERVVTIDDNVGGDDM
ncbi:zinc finger MYM-type protein 1-like [Olea europaea var. sylvestris]|uniref:zinc finger MYM-type protein 1-like n=1 Tax=Olea europaea var. sylvestris TaxID=158386 RepID=UPI000C1CF1BF|nr:zinc finger MYM-type protein 1-like [Olea europaea var. sylvestris]